MFRYNSEQKILKILVRNAYQNDSKTVKGLYFIKFDIKHFFPT